MAQDNRQPVQQSADDQPIGHGQKFFSWQFLEFENYERTVGWYVGAAVIVIGLLIFSVVTGNMLFALLIILAALTIVLFRRRNREISFAITEDGVEVDSQFYDYGRIKSFYIIYQPPTVKTLYFELKGTFSPRVPINLQTQNPLAIREVLLRYLTEDLDHEDEPTSDVFGRMLKL